MTGPPAYANLNVKLSDGVLGARKRSLGFLPADLARPVVAVCNTYSEINLAHLSFDQLSRQVREGVLTAGGMPIEFRTIAVCDSIAHGRLSQKYVLPAREVIADSIEVFVNCHGIFAGLVCIAACDKVVPAALMAAARVDLPAVIVTGGPQLAEVNAAAGARACARIAARRPLALDPERARDEKHVKRLYLQGELSDEEFIELYYGTVATCGICRPYATAGSMIWFTEALGMSLSGSGLVPQLSTEKGALARVAGMQAVRLARDGLTARRVITRESLENALRCVLAVGGANNVIIHALAIADAAGVALSYDDVERLSRTTPLLCDLRNEHGLDMQALDRAGGVLGVLKRLEPLLHLDARTVDGVPLGELLAGCGEVGAAIRPLRAPKAAEAGIWVLRGSLAPRGALLNVGALPADRLGGTYRGPARTYDSQEAFFAGITRERPAPGSVIVLRYEGPRGGPGMRESHRVSELVNHFSLLGSDCILVTDGRFSGASAGFIIGYLAPEAGEPGSPLSLVDDGDEIEVCLARKELNLLVPAAELARRRRERTPYLQPIPPGQSYLEKYRTQVQGAEVGAVLRPAAAGAPSRA